ncbi:MAG: DMT family transporter [Candidatus Pacebacteria bacterium]|nr:DMT family transporter [Candidatus Paceibacterota bacterium]
MNWFLIALGAPILWAIVNIVDDFLVSKYSQKEKERSSGGLVLFSSLIGLLIALFILFFRTGIFSISTFDKILLFVNGGLTVTWIILYLYALEIEEVSNIVPWFLMIPVFGYILGYFFLGEMLTLKQMIGSSVIILGSFFISIDFSGQKNKIKSKPVLYMLGASLALAISGFIFKFVTISGDFWISSFWEYLGLGVLGLFLYLFVPKYRNEFLFMNKNGGKKIFVVNVLSELMSISGNLLTNFALLLAPISMVFLVGTFQPAIVMVLAFIGTKFFPHIIKEDISKEVMVPKTISIILMIIGSIFLFL